MEEVLVYDIWDLLNGLGGLLGLFLGILREEEKVVI